MRSRSVALLIAFFVAFATAVAGSKPASASFWPTCPQGYTDIGVTTYPASDQIFNRVQFELLIYEHNCSNTFSEATDFAIAAEACYLASYPPCTPYPLTTLYLGDSPGTNCAPGGCENWFGITANECGFADLTLPSLTYQGYSYALYGPISPRLGWLYSNNCQHIPSTSFQAQFYKSGEFRYSVNDVFTN